MACLRERLEEDDLIGKNVAFVLVVQVSLHVVCSLGLYGKFKSFGGL